MSIFSGRHYTWLSDELHSIYLHTPKAQKPGVEIAIHLLAMALTRESRGFDPVFFLENVGIPKKDESYKPSVTTELKY